MTENPTPTPSPLTALGNRAKPVRRVDIVWTAKTERKWGDNWNEKAAQPYFTDLATLEVHVHHDAPKTLDARQVLGRLLHALSTNGEGRAGYLDTPQDYDALLQGVASRCLEARAIFHPRDDEDPMQLVEQLKRYADEIRAGKHDVPTINVEQAKAFAELGIAVRPDGIFGYKRKCGRDGCNKPGDDCFGSLDADEAIQGAQKRALVTCSTFCWLDAGADWGMDPTAQVLEGRINDPEFANARRTLQVAGCLRIEKEDDVEHAILVSDWWSRAKAAGPVAIQICLGAADEAIEGSDFDGHPDAISCET